MSKSLFILATGLLCLAFSIADPVVSSVVQEICSMLPAFTKILVPGSCIDWAECGEASEIIDSGTCLEGWYFDKNSAKCSKSSNVECPFAKNLKKPCASEQNGTFLRNPDDCTGFIYCENGVELYSNCPTGLNFNPETSGCVYPNEYTCPKEEEDSSDNAICMSVADNIRMADPTSCTAFKVCNKGILKTTKCIAGTYFSRELKRCSDLEDSDCALVETTTEEPSNIICGTDDEPIVGFISDEVSCSGYYFCDEMENGKADRNPVFGRCEDGKFFDVNSFSCKDRVNVRCLHDRCEGMGTKFANLQGDCSKYTYCNGGVSTSEGSCPEDFYFDEKTQSCTKKVITYLACVD
ncbi:peritrophin-44-like [Episyrphus balteatus]|uniref:peritrophin-44-like n=1 Tax=Episyrphus balteatus TaxID=286459 RepID=UPI00248558C8|nr:peritrophin-44-like [Episyrphus balteatus]